MDVLQVQTLATLNTMALDTGVNAALGASNYTPFLQGAMQGAQMQAQGAQNIGQGLANLGANAGQTLQVIGEQQKQNKVLQGQVDASRNLAQSLLPFAQKISPDAANTIQSFIQSTVHPSIPLVQQAAGAQQFSSHLGEILNFGIQSKAIDDQQKSNIVANYLAQNNGQMPSVIKPDTFTPNQLMTGQQVYNTMAYNRAKTQNELALAYKNSQPIVHSPGETYVIGKQNDWLANNPGSTRNDIPGALISQWSQESQNAGRPIQTPDEQAAAAEKIALSKTRVDTATSELNAKEQAVHNVAYLDSAVNIIKSGNVDTGKLSTLKNNFFNYLSNLGLKLSPDTMDKIANTNELQSYLSSQISSQMSNVRNVRNQREFDAISGAVASMGKGNTTNTILLQRARNEAQHQVDLADNASQYISGAITYDKYNSEKTNLYKKLADSNNTLQTTNQSLRARNAEGKTIEFNYKTGQWQQ
jgi:hypothetical protein